MSGTSLVKRLNKQNFHNRPLDGSRCTLFPINRMEGLLVVVLYPSYSFVLLLLSILTEWLLSFSLCWQNTDSVVSLNCLQNSLMFWVSQLLTKSVFLLFPIIYFITAVKNLKQINSFFHWNFYLKTVFTITHYYTPFNFSKPLTRFKSLRLSSMAISSAVILLRLFLLLQVQLQLLRNIRI